MNNLVICGIIPILVSCGWNGGKSADDRSENAEEVVAQAVTPPQAPAVHYVDEFKHSNIAGHHVSGGVFYKGYKCGPNNGVFTWDPKTGWHFYNYGHADSKTVLKQAAENGGIGFCQSLLFHEGQRFKGSFKASSVNQYRALCELGGKLCVVDCARPLPFGCFMDGLQALDVTNAIYCDMGGGWNYSWYRQDDGTVKELFPVPGKYTTNWVTFYAK